jgi:hypothetical protein
MHRVPKVFRDFRVFKAIKETKDFRVFKALDLKVFKDPYQISKVLKVFKGTKV